MRWLLLVVLLPGCSFAYVHGPPVDHERLEYFDCNSSGAAMTGDVSGAVWSGLTAVSLATVDDSEASVPSGLPIAFGVLSAVYVASAVYGGINGNQCRNAKEELSRRIARDYELHRQTAKALEQQRGQEQEDGGCSKDMDCKGERVCMAGRCVDPANTPTEPASEAPPLSDQGDSNQAPTQQQPANTPVEPQGSSGHFPAADPSN